MNKIFPGKNYIPAIADSPLLVYSPMVFMTKTELAPGLEKVDNFYTALTKFDNHRQLDSNSTILPINYVHTAPNRSNSGLQALVAQFASVAGKKPEELTIADVKKYQSEVQKIQNKISRYGTSTTSLANSMVKNGPYWVSVASVYESSVIAANIEAGTGETHYQAVYPKATFSSNKRAILSTGPWISPAEKDAGEQVIEFLRSPEIQQMAVKLGLRPGVPGVELGGNFAPIFGVNINPTYDSYRSPQPEVVEAMLNSWEMYGKKPANLAIVVDTSGSMQGEKLAAMQNTLLNYIENLGTREKVALMNFNSQINEPVVVEGTKAGRDRAMEFISKLRAQGDSKVYDAILYARNWLPNNRLTDGLNVVIVLSDGLTDGSGSQNHINTMTQKIQMSGASSDQTIKFFVLGYGKEGEFNQGALQQIAQINKGEYRQGEPESIANLMEELQKDF